MIMPMSPTARMALRFFQSPIRLILLWSARFDTSAQSVQAVAVSGNRAYLVGGTGLMVIDVSDPTHPTFMGGIPNSAFNLFLEHCGVG